MRLVTDDGNFLQGDAVDLVVQLGARSRVLVGGSLRTEPAAMLLQLECDRVVRYASEVGSAFAIYAAGSLLEELAAAGLILLCPEES